MRAFCFLNLTNALSEAQSSFFTEGGVVSRSPNGSRKEGGVSLRLWRALRNLSPRYKIQVVQTKMKLVQPEAHNRILFEANSENVDQKISIDFNRTVCCLILFVVDYIGRLVEYWESGGALTCIGGYCYWWTST